MASLALAFDILAKDNASKTFKNVGDAAEKTGKQGHSAGSMIAGGMKLAAGALLGSGIIAGFKGLYDAAAESAKIGRLTTQVIKTTGGAAGVTAKQVGDLATAISKKTGVDDEAIQSGENLLLTFTNVRNEVGKGNDVFNQATALANDMSVALGTDMTSSALALGKALNNPIKGVTALQRVGVSFTASQKEQITTLVESGRTLEAQKVILAELGKEFGGAAEAASTPLDKLKVTLGNLAEEAGGRLIPVVDDLANFLMDDLLPAVGNLEPVFDAAGSTIGFVVDAGGKLLNFFNDLPGPIKATVVAMGGAIVLKGPLSSLFSNVADAAQTMALRALYAKDALAGLGGAGGVAKAGLGGFVGFLGGPWGLAITGAVLGLSLLVDWLSDTDEATAGATEAQQGLADALRQSRGAIDDNVRAAAAKLAQDEDLLDVAQKLGIPLGLVTDAILGQGNALAEVGAKLVGYRDANTDIGTGERNPLAVSANEAWGSLQSLSGQTDKNITGAQQLAEATSKTAPAMGSAAAAADQLTADLQDTADAASDAKKQTDLFKTSLDVLTGAHIDLTEAESAMYEALADAKGAMKDLHGTVLDSAGGLNVQSEAGRKAQDVLHGIRDSGQQYIATLIQQGATADEALAADRRLREGFIKSAMQMGISKEAAGKLADQILGIPSKRETEIRADTKQATEAVQAIQDQINGLKGRVVSITARAIMPDLNGSASGNGRMGTFAEGGFTGEGGTYTPAGIVHAGEFVFTQRQTRKAGVKNLYAMARTLDGYADGGLVGAPISIRAELDARTYESDMNRLAGSVLKHLEPVTRYITALNWAKTQIGKPYIWGGVGPGGYDCSGFMSAITNMIRGRSPYSRVGSTGTFPWPGFAAGAGLFTIGSTPNAGGGIGHMAGTLLGTNVESTGGVGVRMGGAARGASNGLFGQRAHLAYANGGVIGEPVAGVGAYTGRSYTFAERGPETVTPGLPGGGLVGLSIEGTLRVENDGLVRIVDGRIVEALDLVDQRARS